jgi:hypothetical protein
VEIGIIAKVTNALDILADLQIALKGKEDKPGLISEINTLVKKISEWKDTKKWITRLIVGRFITSLLGLLIIARANRQLLWFHPGIFFIRDQIPG